MKGYYYFVLTLLFYIVYRLIFCFTIGNLPLFFGCIVFEGGVKYQFPYSINNRFKTKCVEINTLEFLSKKSIDINAVEYEKLEDNFKRHYLQGIKNLQENLKQDNKIEIQSSIDDDNFILFLIYLKKDNDIKFVARYDKNEKQIVNIEL